MEEVTIGGNYVCRAVGLKELVTGKVEKIYFNTVLLNVSDYQATDEQRLMEYHFKVLVRNEHILSQAGSKTSAAVPT